MEGVDKKDKLLMIGGSAGSLAMVLQILPLFKKSMNIPVVIIFHRKQSEDTVLIDLLSSRTGYTVKEADDKDEIKPGIIYIAPVDYHLLIEKKKTLSLDDSEKVNFSRPSIDVAFESAADVYGPNLTCLLLSGANADGVAGLQAAKKVGATIVVQDPLSAEVPFMPKAAVENVAVDFLLDSSNLPQFIALMKS
jgi:two-component system chemotaxis response regulator CheB